MAYRLEKEKKREREERGAGERYKREGGKKNKTIPRVPMLSGGLDWEKTVNVTSQYALFSRNEYDKSVTRGLVFR